jgi:carboxymethylenebutenolidase
MKILYFTLLFLLIFSQQVFASKNDFKIIEFSSGNLTLRGELFLPEGKGPFPVLLYNHGSAPKMLNSQASGVIGPMFVIKKWVFFMPYRRGQGLSENQGPYIMDEIRSARQVSLENASNAMVNLLKTDHLNDQLAAVAWLKKQDFVQKDRIATMGNSFGGIQVIIGMEHVSYCAGVDASGGAQSWKISPGLQMLMKEAVKKIDNPIFFFQAENDYDLSPSKELSSEMINANKNQKLKIYPNFGNSAKEGHSFPYRGVSIWFDDVYSFLNKYCPEPND